MSTIRFVHTDHFRLGTALSGLSDSPGWLQQLATDCVRQSVRNVIEAAVTRQAQFLLIAGSVTESRDDLESVVRWLDEQFETLRSRGIRVAAVADDAEERAALQRICDIVLQPGQSLVASNPHQGSVHLTASPAAQAATGDLVITIGEHVPHSGSRLSYHAVPSVRPDHTGFHTAQNGTLTCSAGAVQAVSPAETWEGSCLVVDADTTSKTLQSNVITCDVIRFATERVSLASESATGSLIPEVIQASNALNGRMTQTVIVDWILDTRVAADASEVSVLDAGTLLTSLRDRLHGGHHGIWPRTVTLSGESVLRLAADDRTAFEEYFDVANGPVNSVNGTGISAHRPYLHGGIGIGSDLIAGLSLLHRAA